MKCPKCNGNQMIFKTCPKCKGSAQVITYDDDGNEIAVDCPCCDGGQIEVICPRCNGKGEV